MGGLAADLAAAFPGDPEITVTEEAGGRRCSIEWPDGARGLLYVYDDYVDWRDLQGAGVGKFRELLEAVSEASVEVFGRGRHGRGYMVCVPASEKAAETLGDYLDWYPFRYEVNGAPVDGLRVDL